MADARDQNISQIRGSSLWENAQTTSSAYYGSLQHTKLPNRVPLSAGMASFCAPQYSVAHHKSKAFFNNKNKGLLHFALKSSNLKICLFQYLHNENNWGRYSYYIEQRKNMFIIFYFFLSIQENLGIPICPNTNLLAMDIFPIWAVRTLVR